MTDFGDFDFDPDLDIDPDPDLDFSDELDLEDTSSSDDTFFGDDLDLGDIGGMAILGAVDSSDFSDQGLTDRGKSEPPTMRSRLGRRAKPLFRGYMGPCKLCGCTQFVGNGDFCENCGHHYEKH